MQTQACIYLLLLWNPICHMLYLKLLILRVQKIMLGIKISGCCLRNDYIIDKII